MVRLQRIIGAERQGRSRRTGYRNGGFSPGEIQVFSGRRTWRNGPAGAIGNWSARVLLSEMEKVEKEIRERDEQDSSRELAPLHPAADARHIDSTGISAEEVAERILAVIAIAS